MSPAKQPDKPTMRGVAERARVSVAVVSYSFNHPERVADATRARVFAAAEELGYVGPDPAARALRTGRTQTIALYTGDTSVGVSPFLAKLIAGTLAACQSRGLSLTIPTGRIRPACDGAVLLRPEARDVVVDGPHVWVGPPEAGVENLVTHGGAEFMEAMEELARLGHRRITFLSGPGFSPASERVAANLGGEIQTLTSARDDRVAAAESLATALAGSQAPTVVVAMGEAMAFGALDAMADAGLRIPADISLLCAGDRASLPRDATAVGIDVPALGRAAIDQVVALIEGDGSTPLALGSATFVPGTTLGPVPA